MMAAKPCFTCDAVTEHWVLWANARGDMHTVCDNECLSWWIECCREEARRDVVRSWGGAIPLWMRHTEDLA